MRTEIPDTITVLTSTVTSPTRLDLKVEERPVPGPVGEQVLVAVEAAPVNPSDLGALLSVVDPAALEYDAASASAWAPVPERAYRFVEPRLGEGLVPGLEGAGRVVAAGDAPEARALLGRTVAIHGGGTYASHAIVDAANCLALPAGVNAEAGAASFVNPMTVLSLLDIVRREGQRAMIHTAAASNLGRMLIRACASDGIALVNVVRGAANVESLRAIGATHVLDSESPDFFGALVGAIKATGARIVFDAVGGGRLVNQLLAAMEASTRRRGAFAAQYGSDEMKWVYIYGSLDTRPAEISRGYGMAWSVSGLLLFHHLARIGPEAVAAMRQRVVAELDTTFRSDYSRRVGLADLVDPATLVAATRRGTGEKLLVVPR